MGEMFFFHYCFLYKNMIKRLIDNAVHGLLDIDIMHLFTPNFTLLSMFVVNKTGIIFMITSM